MILILAMTGCTTEVRNKNAESATEVVGLPANQVCMINDAYMGKDQIPVPVGDKVYYGCCEGCVDKLTNLVETRYAIDPLTGQRVDKANAFIVRNPKGGSVWYFASKENYLEFTNKKTANSI
mgnify:CR=1 FL=1